MDLSLINNFDVKLSVPYPSIPNRVNCDIRVSRTYTTTKHYYFVDNPSITFDMLGASSMNSIIIYGTIGLESTVAGVVTVTPFGPPFGQRIPIVANAVTYYVTHIPLGTDIPSATIITEYIQLNGILDPREMKERISLDILKDLLSANAEVKGRIFDYIKPLPPRDQFLIYPTTLTLAQLRAIIEARTAGALYKFMNIPRTTFASNPNLTAILACLIYQDSGTAPENLFPNILLKSIFSAAQALDPATRTIMRYDQARTLLTILLDNNITLDQSFCNLFGINISWESRRVVSTQVVPTQVDDRNCTVKITFFDLDPNGTIFIEGNINLNTGVLSTTLANLVIGNAVKNQRIGVLISTPTPTPANQNEVYKLLIVKMLGDLVQCFLFFIVNILTKFLGFNKDCGLLITTDNVVLATCMMLMVPVISTGTQLGRISGCTTIEYFEPGNPKYLKQYFCFIDNISLGIKTFNTVMLRGLLILRGLLDKNKTQHGGVKNNGKSKKPPTKGVTKIKTAKDVPKFRTEHLAPLVKFFYFKDRGGGEQPQTGDGSQFLTGYIQEKIELIDEKIADIRIRNEFITNDVKIKKQNVLISIITRMPGTPPLTDREYLYEEQYEKYVPARISQYNDILIYYDQYKCEQLFSLIKTSKTSYQSYIIINEDFVRRMLQGSRTLSGITRIINTTTITTLGLNIRTDSELRTHHPTKQIPIPIPLKIKDIPITEAELEQILVAPIIEGEGEDEGEDEGEVDEVYFGEGGGKNVNFGGSRLPVVDVDIDIDIDIDNIPIENIILAYLYHKIINNTELSYIFNTGLEEGAEGAEETEETEGAEETEAVKLAKLAKLAAEAVEAVKEKKIKKAVEAAEAVEEKKLLKKAVKLAKAKSAKLAVKLAKQLEEMKELGLEEQKDEDTIKNIDIEIKHFLDTVEIPSDIIIDNKYICCVYYDLLVDYFQNNQIDNKDVFKTLNNILDEERKKEGNLYLDNKELIYKYTEIIRNIVVINREDSNAFDYEAKAQAAPGSVAVQGSVAQAEAEPQAEAQAEPQAQAQGSVAVQEPVAQAEAQAEAPVAQEPVAQAEAEAEPQAQSVPGSAAAPGKGIQRLNTRSNKINKTKKVHFLSNKTNTRSNKPTAKSHNPGSNRTNTRSNKPTAKSLHFLSNKTNARSNKTNARSNRTSSNKLTANSHNPGRNTRKHSALVRNNFISNNVLVDSQGGQSNNFSRKHRKSNKNKKGKKTIRNR